MIPTAGFLGVLAGGLVIAAAIVHTAGDLVMTLLGG
jgi:hypothetical protein